MEKTNFTKSVSRATEILLCLSQSINTVTGISDACSLSVSTVHRLLKTLEELKWVRQDRLTHRYYLGELVTEISSNHLALHQELIVYALNEMIRLADITEETINLGVMINLNYILLKEIPSKHNLKITESKRYGLPIKGAAGKVMLSQLSDAEIKHTLEIIRRQEQEDTANLETPYFMARINEIRSQGYDVSFNEVIVGGCCIAVPIKNYTYPVTLCIIGPESRTRPRVEEFVKELKVSTEIISDYIEKSKSNARCKEVITGREKSFEQVPRSVQ